MSLDLTNNDYFSVLMLLSLSPIIFGTIIITIKRLHDFNHSWWWTFTMVFVGFILFFIPWSKWDNNFWNKSSNNESDLLKLWLILLISIILFIIAFIFYTHADFSDSANTINTQTEESICWKNSIKWEDDKCYCIEWYVRENYEDDNNPNCIKSK